MGTNRDLYPYELTPARRLLQSHYVPQPTTSQRNPRKRRLSQTVSINERESGAQEAKIIVDRFVGKVGHDGVGERGENVEGEDEGCQRPKRTVQVCGWR